MPIGAPVQKLLDSKEQPNVGSSRKCQIEKEFFTIFFAIISLIKAWICSHFLFFFLHEPILCCSLMIKISLWIAILREIASDRVKDIARYDGVTRQFAIERTTF
jgi:hypothetical protein